METGPSEAIFRDPRHPYTRLLLANAGADHGVLPEGGGLGPPALAGIGCVVAERCPLADARCRRERPALIEANAVAVACHAVAEGRDGP